MYTDFNDDRQPFPALCNYCGAEYNHAFGNHICDVDDLAGIISDRREFDAPPRLGEKSDGEIRERIKEIQNFWKRNPNYQLGVTKQLQP